MIWTTARRKSDGLLYVPDGSPAMPDPVTVCSNAARAMGGYPSDYEFIILTPAQLAMYASGDPIYLEAGEIDLTPIPPDPTEQLFNRQRGLLLKGGKHKRLTVLDKKVSKQWLTL